MNHKSMLEIFNPTEYPDWDNLLETNEESNFFHTTGWAKVLTESYGYKPLYFAQIQNNKLTGLIAVMEINSILTGKRGVSLPYSDHVPPIAKSPDHFHEMFEKMVEYGKENGWKSIQIRGGQEYFHGKLPLDTFILHTLDISSRTEDIILTFRDSTERNIRQSVKRGVDVAEGSSLDDMKQFYNLNCLTRRVHGLPTQPFLFFKKIDEHIISKKKGSVLLGKIEDKNIAGAIFAKFNGKAFFKYGASDKRYHNLRPNNLVMWKAIKKYALNGAITFNFGRTNMDHEGLLQYKRGWGAEEKRINYYKYDLRKEDFVKDFPKFKTSYSFFKKMPISMLKILGFLIYKHIG